MKTFIELRKYMKESVYDKESYGPYKASDLASANGVKKIPTSRGLYFWWLEKSYAKEIGLTGHDVKGHTLVYVGLSAKPTSNLRSRLGKWELGDLVGKRIMSKSESPYEEWVKWRAKSKIQYDQMAAPVKTISSFLESDFFDAAVRQKFIANLYLTFTSIDSDKFSDEELEKHIHKMEKKLIKKYKPQLNVSDTKSYINGALKKERLEMKQAAANKSADRILKDFDKDYRTARQKKAAKGLSADNLVK